MHAMQDFRLTTDGIVPVGSGLHRPECVLTTRSGDLYVSDELGGIAHIRPDRSTARYHGRSETGQSLGANGFAMLPDGSFLLAPVCGGAVHRLWRDGRAQAFLSEVDGLVIDSPNFVLLDDRERIWICVLSRSERKKMKTFLRDQRDGYIILVDNKGARIVADNIGFPNEVRIHPAGKYLYTTETLAARLLRYPLHEDGSLGIAEVMCDFDESNMFDGFGMDAEGGCWITSLVSNRMWYYSPRGEVRLLSEEFDPDQLKRLTVFQKTTGVPRSLLYEEWGSRFRNISSVAFGGPDLRTVHLGSLMGESILTFRAPVAGQQPAHWNFGPF
jgi:sugar lactone lactonase YvrE